MKFASTHLTLKFEPRSLVILLVHAYIVKWLIVGRGVEGVQSAARIGHLQGSWLLALL